MPHTIPVVMFLRPNGRRAPGAIEVPAEYETPEKIGELNSKLASLAEHGIMITTEDIPGDAANVCLDDGEFDYKVELFPLDETLAKRITELVLSFDEEDYLRAKERYDG